MKRGSKNIRIKLKALAVHSVAAAVTGGLFLTMTGLVANDETKIIEIADGRIFIDVTQGPDEVEPPIVDTPVPKPPVITYPPKIPPEPCRTCKRPVWDPAPPPVPPKPDPTGTLNLGQTDGDMIVLAAFPPHYPRNHANNGIEGYVLLSLTVNAYGQVEDPYVLKSEPDGVFDRAALKAIGKFKFKPRIVDGVGTPVYNVRYKMSFELED